MRFLLLLLLAGVPLAASADIFKARLEWAHTVDLRFVEDGIVDQVAVLVGQEVGAGEVLVELDPREFEFTRTEAAALEAAAGDNSAGAQLAGHPIRPFS